MVQAIGEPVLLAIFEVPQEDRVLCQAESCGHSVYKRIHVVRAEGRLTLLGSECFKRLFGMLVESGEEPLYGSAEGRALTQEERARLKENTERFLAQFVTDAEVDAIEEAVEAESRRAEQAVRSEQAAADRASRQREEAEATRAREAQWESRQAAERQKYLAENLERMVDEVDPRDFARAQSRVKGRLRTEIGIDPELPGWSGWVRLETRKLLRKFVQGEISLEDGTAQRTRDLW